MTRSVHVVPHTHWDREWYEPYPVFRARLVELLDGLLPRLERDPSFAHFQLDGQMAVVDDYLEVRPGQAERLRRLAADGRLSMGPWYVLPDEFLVSGETLVRDLQLGLRRAGEFGGAMRVGYLPDMFGHVAQMPQILSLFGFHDAVVWRGVPASVEAPAFEWVAPDGSSVRAEYLSAGYGNGSTMPAEPERLRRRIEGFVATQGPLVGPDVLWMAGMDHEVPPDHLGATVEALDRIAPYEVRVGSLEEHLAGAPREHLQPYHGELRSGARANLLMGVASNRVDVKVAAARAERALERLAEPLDALWQPDPSRWGPLLQLAWLEVIRNAAHDSICACSHDDVVDAVLHRYAEATATAEQVAQRAASAAAARMSSPGVHLLNPGPRARSEVVEVTVPTEQLRDVAHQVLREQPAVEELHRSSGADAPVVVAREMIFEHPDTAGARLVGTAPGELEVHLLPERADDSVSRRDALAELGRRCAAEPDLVVVTVLHRAVPRTTALVHSGEVPGFGWRRWPLAGTDRGGATPAPVVALDDPARPTLDNGLVHVEVDPADGTYGVSGVRGGPAVAGLGRLVDGGDAGDTYNWCPPEHDLVVDAPQSVEVRVAEAGPLRARLAVRTIHLLPERLECAADGGLGRVGERAVRVDTTLELRSGETFLRVCHELDHHVRDHRLRVHLPLPERARSSRAECAYAVVERPLWAEGGPNEWGLATFPSRRFVSAGGLTVTHEGLCEYELVDLDGDAHDPTTTAGELALTLVRATGWLSRGPMASRPLPAGPELPLEGAQVQGPLRLAYAVSLDDLPGAPDPHELAGRVWCPLLAVEADGGGDLPERGARLSVEGMEVDALLRDGDHLVLRGHEAHGRRSTLRLDRPGSVVDLAGAELGRTDGTTSLRPWQIVTVRLDPPV
jgi:hypothetical protein